MKATVRPRVVLITGTDTEVGKTLVGAGLSRYLVRRGSRVLAVKPVESGCGEVTEDAQDGVCLARATGQTEPLQALVRLRAPLAPPLAADREGVRLEPAGWCETIRTLGAGHDVVLVEGAGGLLSPLTWEVTARELAVELSAEALVVVPDRLGCLNHALLTLEVLRTAGVPVLGVVLNAPHLPDDSTGTNADALRLVTRDTRVVSLPRVENSMAAASYLATVADWLDG